MTVRNGTSLYSDSISHGTRCLRTDSGGRLLPSCPAAAASPERLVGLQGAKVGAIQQTGTYVITHGGGFDLMTVQPSNRSRGKIGAP